MAIVLVQTVYSKIKCHIARKANFSAFLSGVCFPDCLKDIYQFCVIFTPNSTGILSVVFSLR